MIARVQVAVAIGFLMLVLIPVGVVGAGTMGESDASAQRTSAQQKDGAQHVEIEARQDIGGAQAVTDQYGSGEPGTDVGGGVISEEIADPDVLTIEERARIQVMRPATGDGEFSRQHEMRIARRDIVARPVGPISKERYKRLYKKAAARHGFGEDWYVLAAVGWVESRHGENMGPSSAGAMGPMQFLPSTWRISGVDGNRDGVKNILDPRDAIPAAARYLERGGAPEDWHAALYTYNHSESYVEGVLDSAERYRRLARDGRVGPYN